jgi:hypothetical protein
MLSSARKSPSANDLHPPRVLSLPETASLDRSIPLLIDAAQEERIIDLLKSSSLADINAVSSSSWEAMVPVLLCWTTQKNLERQAMAFSIAYHIMQQCPDVYVRPSVARAVSRLAAVCYDQDRAGNDFSQMGGLSHRELRDLSEFLRAPTRVK